ncbi:MAG TPA: proton-conducting transporter membrane subunit, partial [Acidobacteriaceae bacterium]
GGLSTPMPKLAAFFLFVALSSMGLPMLNGFVGEFLILLGTFQAHWNWSTWAATGVILSACYLLWSYQRVFYGDVTVEKNRKLPDASGREKWILATMAVITLWMGIYSPFFTRRFAAPSQNVLDQMQRQFPQEAAAPGSSFRPERPGSFLRPVSGRPVAERRNPGLTVPMAQTAGTSTSEAAR